MPLPRFQRLAEDKRTQLLEIASSEFSSKGFEGASLNEILAGAGLGKSSYYYYFADKEDLYATCAEHALAQLLPELPELSLAELTPKTFWPALEEFAGEAIAIAVRHMPALTFFRHMQPMWKQPTPRFQALATQFAVPLVEMIKVGQALGCVRTDLEIDRLLPLIRAADAALDEPLMARSDVTAEDLEEHGRLVIDTLRRLLVPAPVPPKRKPVG